MITDDSVVADPAPPALRVGRIDLALLALAAAVGVAIRIWILITPRLGYLDSDEAVVGLMADNFPSERPIFFWGQAYGGVAEPLLTSVVFRATGGASVLGLKLVPLMLSAVAAVLVGLIGARLGSTRLGVIAGSLFWVWPAPFVWWSTKARGFYWVVAVVGLLAVLLVLQLAAKTGPDRGRALWWRALVLGGALGVGWWSSPQIALLVVPVGVWFVVTAWPRAWRAAPGVAIGFLVGSIPWWVENVRSGFDSLEPPAPVTDPFLSRLGTMLTDGTPMMLGTKVPYTEVWMPLGPLVFALVGAAVIAGAVLLVRDDWRGPGLAIVATLVAYPVLAALSPLSGYVGEGRYLVFAAPFVALALGALGARVPIGVAAVGVGALAVTTVIVLAQFTAVPGPNASNVAVPDDIGPLIGLLEELDVRTAEADYWLAHRISFETDEEITVATRSGIVRYKPYQDAVARGADARVFMAGSEELAEFEALLASEGRTFPKYEVAEFVVFDLKPEPVVSAP